VLTEEQRLSLMEYNRQWLFATPIEGGTNSPVQPEGTYSVSTQCVVLHGTGGDERNGVICNDPKGVRNANF
jgi:hypothetical protein